MPSISRTSYTKSHLYVSTQLHSIIQSWLQDYFLQIILTATDFNIKTQNFTIYALVTMVTSSFFCLPTYQVASWSVQPFGHKTWAKNWGDCDPFLGELGLYLTESRLGRGLPPYQVGSWSIQPVGHTRRAENSGAVSPFFEAELGPHLTQSRLGQGLHPYQVSS